jgi:hypothetical protein
VDAKLAAGEEVHKDLVKMRTLQVEKALALRDEDMGLPTQGSNAPLASARVKKPRREHRSQASTENHHCGFCGLMGHKQRTCPQVEALVEAQAAGEAPLVRTKELTGKDRQLAELVARMKYTWIEQRSEVYEGRKPRAREEQTVTGHQLCRMSAKDMCDFDREWGLLEDLQGRTCPNPQCEAWAEAWEAYSDHNTLGPMRARSNEHAVLLRTAWHRCGACRQRQSVHLGNRLFSQREHVEEATYSF